MLKHVTFLGAAAVAMSLSTGASAQDVTADTVIAIVDGTEITMGEIIIARTQLPPQYAQFPNSVLLDGLVDQLIQQQILADAVANAPKRIDYIMRNERRSLLAAETITAIAEAISEEEIVAAYEARFPTVEDVPEFRASHLLVDTQEEAAAAKARIDEGQAFAEVARDVSTGPTGPNGGDLGWFGAGAMVPEFENQITALEIDGVSDPFETQFGWHVATLTETRVQAKPTLEEMRRELTADLQEAAVSARLDDLTADVVIVRPLEGEIDPDLIARTDLLAD